MAPITQIPRSIKPAANAFIFGVGNSTDNFVIQGTDQRAIEMRLNSPAASGDTRGMYLQLKLSGAGGGEAARFLANASTTGVAAGGTINGVHSTMTMDTSSTISGAGNAIRATLAAAAATRTLSGTCAALQLDSDIGANNTVPASWSFIRVTDSNSVRCNQLLNLPAASNGTLLAAHVTDAMTHSIKCIANGTPIYIMCTTTATNRS